MTTDDSIHTCNFKSGSAKIKENAYADVTCEWALTHRVDRNVHESLIKSGYMANKKCHSLKLVECYRSEPVVLLFIGVI